MKTRLVCFALLAQAYASLPNAYAADRPTLITSSINEAQLVRLTGNTHPLATAAHDKGAAPDSLPMDRMLLLLKRSAQQQSALAQYLGELQDPDSANYHNWLTPQEYGARYGLSDEDLQTVTGWLESHGFKINHVSNSRAFIDFSGTAGQVQAAFHTAIHQFVVNGESHWANAQDPQLPAALVAAVGGIASLHNFTARSQVQVASEKVNASLGGNSVQPQFTASNGGHYVAPGDFATIYNTTPTLNSGINGSGVVIAIVGRTTINVQDVISFRSVFGLPSNPPQIIINGPSPGDLGGNEELEAVLDTSWAGAVAPNATVDLVVSASTNSTDGVTLSEQYIIDNNLANVMSESFGDCEANYTQASASSISEMAQQAAAYGITYTVSSGDSGSAGCDNSNESSATGPLSVNALASTPYTVAVGGTQFAENGQGYWSSTNSSTLGSAISYIPEDVWNSVCINGTCGSGSILASGGGVSQYFQKPSWQTGVAGIPSGSMRSVPDVSLTAALHDPYLVCIDGSCTPNAQGQISFTAVGGTSASAPSFAGIFALVDQKLGARQGQVDNMLYAFAATETFANCNASTNASLPASNCIFNDITVGTNAVPGEPKYNTASETYNATVGYDLATGLGSVNATNLVNAFAKQTGGTTGTTGITVSPASGSGSSATFTFTYNQPNQSQEHFLLNSTFSGNGSCYFLYDRGSGNLMIANDQGNGILAQAPPGSSVILANDQCSASAASASVTASGNTVTLTLTINFASGFAGAKNIYATTVNTSNQETPFQQIGTWTVR